MGIMRWHKSDDHYISVNRYFLEDNRLSFKARGLLGYLATKPDGWTINHRHLGSDSVGPDGATAVLSALKELEDAGYLRRTRIRGKDGRWRGWDQDLWDYPKYRNRVAENRTRITTTPSNTKYVGSKEEVVKGTCGNCGAAFRKDGSCSWCDRDRAVAS